MWQSLSGKLMISKLTHVFRVGSFPWCHSNCTLDTTEKGQFCFLVQTLILEFHRVTFSSSVWNFGDTWTKSSLSCHTFVYLVGNIALPTDFCYCFYCHSYLCDLHLNYCSVLYDEIQVVRPYWVSGPGLCTVARLIGPITKIWTSLIVHVDCIYLSMEFIWCPLKITIQKCSQPCLAKEKVLCNLWKELDRSHQR